MAFDCFLKVEGIDGECTDEPHKKWIEVLSYKHGVSQRSSGSASSGGGRTAQRCDHQDFSVTKTLDKTSPKLALYCCNGTHIPEVKVELCRAGGEKQKYMVYKMTDAIVSSARPSGTAQDEPIENAIKPAPLPVEEVTFNYGKIDWAYTETDHKTGKPKGDVAAHWDLTANKGG